MISVNVNFKYQIFLMVFVNYNNHDHFFILTTPPVFDFFPYTDYLTCFWHKHAWIYSNQIYSNLIFLTALFAVYCMSEKSYKKSWTVRIPVCFDKSSGRVRADVGDGKPTASRACVKAPLWLLAFSAQCRYPILPVSKTTAYLETLHSTTGEALRVTWAAGRAVLCVCVWYRGGKGELCCTWTLLAFHNQPNA